MLSHGNPPARTCAFAAGPRRRCREAQRLQQGLGAARRNPDPGVRRQDDRHGAALGAVVTEVAAQISPLWTRRDFRAVPRHPRRSAVPDLRACCAASFPASIRFACVLMIGPTLNRGGAARHVDVNSPSRELEVRYPPRAIEHKHRDQRSIHRVARKVIRDAGSSERQPSEPRSGRRVQPT
jgi:hypothetical protein